MSGSLLEVAKELHLHIMIEAELLKRIDDYRYANRIPSRSEAIRQLIIQSLEMSDKKNIERRQKRD